MFTIFNKQIQSCAFIVLKSSGSRSGGHVSNLPWVFGEEGAFVSSASERLGKIITVTLDGGLRDPFGRKGNRMRRHRRRAACGAVRCGRGKPSSAI